MSKKGFTWISKEMSGIDKALADISAITTRVVRLSEDMNEIDKTLADISVEIKQLSENIDEFIKEYKNERSE